MADLESYKDAYLQCRDLRHHWKVLGYFTDNGEYKRRLQCQNCPTGAIDTISGWRTRRTYTYPDDYHLKGKVTVHEVRQEAIARASVFESQEALEATLPRRYRNAG